MIFQKKKSSDIKPSFWKDGYFRLFISHLATDKKNATILKEELEKYSISGFVAHADIEPTKEWQDEIEIALSTCDSMVALMVNNFHESKWTDQEIGFAMGRDILIIPIRMGQDPYGFIAKFQAISSTNMSTLTNDIFDSILKNKKTNKKMSYALMYKFENSNSFAAAKKNIDYLERIDYWDNTLISRLKSAQDNNSQISDASNVPHKIERLLSRIENSSLKHISPR